MQAVIGVLVMMLGASYGLETHCDGRQDGAQCFGPLGGTVVLQLMDRALVTERYLLYKSSATILYVINNMIVTNAIKSRSSFNPSDGTFRVNNLSRTDSAEYTFKISDSIHIKEKRALQLTIQAPVSSVRLASECLSQGEKRVSCSSGGGDSPQYNWTLGGRSLTDTELLSVNTETNSITLKQHVSGIVACSVENNVSRFCGFTFIKCTSNETQISQWVFAANNMLCFEPTTPPTTISESSTVGLETYCDGRQDGAHCFGPLGGTVVLQLMDRALETQRYLLYKSTTVILTVINNTIVRNVLKSRSSFNPSDGTFRVNNLSRTDRAEYKLEIRDSIQIKENRALRLTIQAPVSSVRLASECLSQGEKRVSCSSGGGDSPQYNWTLGGRSLTDTELLSVNTETNSITLRQHVSGAVACSVRNNVSQVSKGEEISNCGFIFINCTSNGRQIPQWVFAANTMLCVEPDSSTAADHSLLVCGVRAAVVVFALIGIAVYFAWKKNNYKKAEGSAYRPEREHQDESVVMVEM
ncbi:uncharacterized protein LOC117556027 [Gymnodraco acuticeps]|uniref:Uncharacterized protein LOC117556027 n=1 Tax=Gymnodraco acuticeps TaxID=8218 RepID=A0A6P8VKM4_GYMAC|nr:uncharacterized protein LOC117556027 [Gymnodraco acuticeps]